jgi:hypothetical protein
MVCCDPAEPAFMFPVTPTPPATIKAPFVVLVLAVLEVITRLAAVKVLAVVTVFIQAPLALL